MLNHAVLGQNKAHGFVFKYHSQKVRYKKKLWLRMSPEQREKYRKRQNNYQREYQRRCSKQMSPEQREKWQAYLEKYPAGIHQAEATPQVDELQGIIDEEHDKFDELVKELRDKEDPGQVLENIQAV